MIKLFAFGLLLGLCTSNLLAQASFDANAYQQFLQNNQNLTASDLLARHAPNNTFYSDLKLASSPKNFAYFDSVQIKYKLTEGEIALLARNHFVVSERLSFGQIGNAFHDIYIKDLPVMVTTDAVLFALHASYDKILIALEASILEANLKLFLNGLAESFPKLVDRYRTTPGLQTALADVDIYVTLANSLLLEQQLKPQLATPAQVDALWQGIQAEQMTQIPLFSERERKIDFSQFTVRGHYTSPFWTESGERTLAAYFKTMMWLGRIDFMLTPPPLNSWELPWTREEMRRMNLGAVLLNELIDLAQVRPLLEENDEMIRFLVGESDNLTPAEMRQILAEQGVTSAAQLLDDPTYDAVTTALRSSQNAGQKILSNFMMMDPFATEPDTLPVSYCVLGQRFIVDSYIFYNVVFPQIFYQNQKIWRPLPDALDAMFVLGNDNALPLLEKELNEYQYASQAAALRYLVNSYDPEFWDSSLYNVWLNSIRQLNPPSNIETLPLFMHSTAWQAQKLNTQLASWAQLRHDNLLYAKQSYTGGTGCSYPHSFVEPFPEFYESIGNFAAIAGAYFSEMPYSGFTLHPIKTYFPKLEKVMRQLAEISRKEIARQPLSTEEILFLKEMLFVPAGSGEPPYTGWFGDLFIDPWTTVQEDFVIADVHTQPTELDGTEIGRVLHVAVGNFNLGVFLGEAPANGYTPTAFVGPVMSYYELKTLNYDRMTDQRWAELVQRKNVPARPDWVNVYLADAKGNSLQPGRELSGAHYTNVDATESTNPRTFCLTQNYPNPFNPVTSIIYTLPQESQVRIAIYDVAGRQVDLLKNESQPAGHYQIRWDAARLASGVYFCHLQAGTWQQTIKMILMR